MRCTVLLAVGLLLLGFVAADVGAPSAHAAPKQNIVLFVCDDLGPDLGCYGNQTIRTPHIDSLAAAGLRFTQAYATTASCSASRSVILTGLYNHANGHYGHEHAYHHFRAYDRVKSLPVRLTEAGYRTARIGKYHVAPEAVFRFETALPGNARSPVEMANNCGQFLSANDERPFFLYFCTADPHRSGGSVAGAAHNPNPFGNRPQGYPGVAEVTYTADQVSVPPFLPDTPVCRAELAQYYQSVSRIDQGVGRLIELLKQAGVFENTLFIFTSDHGIAFPGGKTTTYEPGLIVPFLVAGPGVEHGVCEAMITHADIAPTLLDVAGVLPKTPELHGRSWLELLARPQAVDNWQEMYASHTFHEITMYYPMRVVRAGRYKLIWNIASPLPYPFASDLWEAPTWQDVWKKGPDAYYGRRTVAAYIHRSPFELFDLENDPDETNNLAESETHARVLADLKQKLQAFQKRTNDPWELKWRYE